MIYHLNAYEKHPICLDVIEPEGIKRVFDQNHSLHAG